MVSLSNHGRLAFLFGAVRSRKRAKTAPFIYDVGAEGKITGIEILHVSQVLAPDDWQKARLPGTGRADAAE